MVHYETRVEVLSPNAAMVNKCRGCGTEMAKLDIINALYFPDGKILAWAQCGCGEVYRVYR